MPPPFFAPWGRTTQTHQTHHLKSRGGSSTYQIEILRDHPQGKGDHHHAPQDHPQEVEVGVAEAVAEAEAGEEHSHYQDMRPPSRLKSF